MLKHLDLTLPTPEENLACDEALIDWCENGCAHEILRFWQPQTHFVVLGYSNKINVEVYLKYCQKHQIPVLRRTSGGGTVLQGPGCLNYSLILNLKRAELANVRSANQFIMEKQRQALSVLLKQPVQVEGHTDLTLARAQTLKKFSGNAQRRKRNTLLFHGSFLIGLDLKLVEATLKLPPKRPCYRKDRTHTDFMQNLSVSSQDLKTTMRKIWNANQDLEEPPKDRIKTLVNTRYRLKTWNEKF